MVIIPDRLGEYGVLLRRVVWSQANSPGSASPIAVKELPILVTLRGGWKAYRVVEPRVSIFR